MRSRWLAILFLLFSVAESSPTVKAAATDPIAHDPTMIKQGQYYYVIITGDAGKANTYLPIKRSTDLIHWQELGPVFSTPPQWVVDTLGVTPRDFWAPDINYFNGEYHVYYAASQFGVNNSVIGLATNVTLDPNSPNYQWIDEGMVVRSQVGDSFNAIDANLTFDHQGVPWLSLGSFWSGIVMRRLDAATGKLSATDPTLYPLVDRHWPPNAVEGPTIIFRGGSYYLFASFDFCCRGVNSEYRVVVGRSANITGPYVDQTGLPLLNGGGTELLRGYNEFAGPGHGDIYVDGRTDWYVHHYYATDDNGLPKLSVRKITWSDGWPTLGDPLSGSQQVGHGGAYFKVVEKSSGQLIATPPDGSQAPLCGYEGADIQLANDQNGSCQQWRLEYAGGGYYGVRNRHSNKVFDVAFCGYADGTNIGQWGWLNNDCQTFRFVPTTDGWMQIQNRNQPNGQPGKFVDASPPCAANEANIQLWAQSTERCQQFRLQPVGDVLLVNANSGKVLDVAGCGSGDGTNVIQRTQRDTRCQLWQFSHIDNGHYTIVNTRSGRHLGVAGCKDQGSNIVLTRPSATDRCAHWRLEPLNAGGPLIDGGTFRLVSRDNNHVVAVEACSTADRANVERQPWTSSLCQQFKIVLP